VWIVRHNMSAFFKLWRLRTVVAINGLFVPLLAYSWLSIYEECSYPIDYPYALERLLAHLTRLLVAAAMTILLTVVIYPRTIRDLSRGERIATLVITGGAAFVAITIALWRYLNFK
jgi:membrane-associated PAP2 superfamily phosphatase